MTGGKDMERKPAMEKPNRRDRRDRERFGALVILAVTVLVLAIAVTRLFLEGPLASVIRDPRTLEMMAELAAVFLWIGMLLTVWLFRGHGSRRRYIAGGSLGGILLGILVFLWRHQIILPVLASGVYMASLAALGRMILRRILRGRVLPLPQQWSFGLVTGSALWIILVCAISLTGHGGIRLWRLLGVLLCAVMMVSGAKALYQARKQAAGHRPEEEERRFHGLFPELRWLPVNKTEALLLAFILTMILLQAGRMNIELDYDSLHYGLRSAYVLDNGRGIYENLGMVNLVYTYSKGLEVLALPLSGTPTYGFVLAFSFWATAGILGVSAVTAYRYTGRKGAYLTAAVISAVPGIMNMAPTAKCDNMTLLLQLIIYDYLCLTVTRQFDKTGTGGRENEISWLVLAVAVYILSLVFKPTAVVFSTALGGAGILCLLLGRRKPVFRPADLLSLILPALAAAGLLYRTWLFTGVPITSIFAGIFEKIGFTVRYPYQFSHVIGDPSALTAGEKLERLLSRLQGILLAPVGEDMAHVIIAWGTGLILILALIWLQAVYCRRYVYYRRYTGRRKAPGAAGAADAADAAAPDIPDAPGAAALNRFDTILLAVLTAGSLASIYTLYQVDGNYFILFYGVLAISAVRMALSAFAEKGAAAGMLRCLLIPLFLCNAVITCTTGWAGASGLTPGSLNSRGYYDHRADETGRFISEGSLNLAFSFEPRDRVLAFGTHPDVLKLPCSVQSYYDVTGAGGNVYLVKKLAYFKEFLEYAEIRYFFVEAGYLADQPRALEIIEDMIEEGTLTDLCFEWGNVRAVVDLDGLPPEDPQAAVEEFHRLYRMEANAF